MTVCRKCLVDQPDAAFGPSARSASGLDNRCRTCERKRLNAYAAANRERVRAVVRKSYARHIDKRRAEGRAKAKTPAGRATAARHYRKHKRKILGRVYAYHETLRGRAVRLANSARRNAKEQGVPFSITVADILPLLTKAVESGACTTRSNCHDTASIDRKIPKLGYVLGNIQIIPWWLNAAFNRFDKESVMTSLTRFKRIRGR